jgi:hypothetical protein
MTEAEFDAARVKWDEIHGPRVGDWYQMKDGSEYRFGRDLGEGLQLAADTSGSGFFLDAEGIATYGGPLLSEVIIQKSSLGKPLHEKERGFFNQGSAYCRVFEEK